jgi:hypothetical protein
MNRIQPIVTQFPEEDTRLVNAIRDAAAKHLLPIIPGNKMGISVIMVPLWKTEQDCPIPTGAIHTFGNMTEEYLYITAKAIIQQIEAKRAAQG